MKKVLTSIFIVIALTIQMMSSTVNAAVDYVSLLQDSIYETIYFGELNGFEITSTGNLIEDPELLDLDILIVEFEFTFIPVNGSKTGKFEFKYVYDDGVHDEPVEVEANTSTIHTYHILMDDLLNLERLEITFEAAPEESTQQPNPKPILPPVTPEVKPPVTPPATNNQPSSSSSNGNAWGTVAQSGGSTTTKTSETTTTATTSPTAPSAPTPTVTTKSFINGFENGTVRPNDLITRAQLAQIVYSLYYKSGDVSGVNYSEVSSSHWAYNAISFVSAQGYMTGYPDGTFKPDAPITRAEIATVISRLKNLQNSQQATFTDVSGHWATEHINKLVAAGFISGYPDNTFKPNDNATRAEAVSIISKAEGRSGKYTGSKSFSDLPATHWAYDVMMNATNGN